MASEGVLVVGATGILAPAAAQLIAADRDVVGISRGNRDAPPGVVRVHVDAHDGGALLGALAPHRWQDAIVYAPAVSDDALRIVRERTPRRTVLVRTSGAADPARGILVVPDDTLQLGWTAGDAPRWHTPAEVSDAALAVLADGRARTLGVVRPWGMRP